MICISCNKEKEEYLNELCQECSEKMDAHITGEQE